MVAPVDLPTKPRKSAIQVFVHQVTRPGANLRTASIIRTSRQLVFRQAAARKRLVYASSGRYAYQHPKLSQLHGACRRVLLPSVGAVA
jgi:hypothetical protein